VGDARRPTMFARIGIVRALNRHAERVFNPSRKETHWRGPKLARDANLFFKHAATLPARGAYHARCRTAVAISTRRRLCHKSGGAQQAPTCCTGSRLVNPMVSREQTLIRSRALVHRIASELPIGQEVQIFRGDSSWRQVVASRYLIPIPAAL